MARFGFVGATYTSQSSNVDAERAINWYVERVEAAGASALALYPSPGLEVFCTLPGEAAIYGGHNVGGRVFVAGVNLWELKKDGSYTNLGALSGVAGRVYFATNNADQLAITSGGTLYLLNLKTGELTNPPTGQGKVSSVHFLDGYFVCLIADSQKFQISALEDGTKWGGLDLAAVSEFPDKVLGMVVDHRELWLFGATKSVAYYNSGNVSFPFAPIPGASMEQGISAPDSIVKIENSHCWIGADERGNAVAWMAQGYLPARISNHAVETAWQKLATTDDAVGYSYQEQGHQFWVLYFPSAATTWVFDITTGLWHERSSRVNDVDQAHLGRCHVFGFGKHLIGDRQSGKVYNQSVYLYSDADSPIRRVRRAPHITQELMFMFHKQMQVHLEVGVGPDQPLPGPVNGANGFIIQDSDGQLWDIYVTEVGGVDGILQAAPVDEGHPRQLMLRDTNDPELAYRITMDNGVLQGTPATVTGGGWRPVLHLLSRVTGKQWILVSNDGVLQVYEGVDYGRRDPQVMLRWSDDGGHTWSNERIKGIGQAGQYRARCYWTRLGRSRDRIYELSASDPVPFRIVDAYLDASPGYGPTERLASAMRKSG